MIGVTHSADYPNNFIKGKLCMMKNIEEFSVSFQEKEDTRDFSLKYKLIMISLMFLIESSNQYFYLSARSELHIKMAEVSPVIFPFFKRKDSKRYKISKYRRHILTFSQHRWRRDKKHRCTIIKFLSL